MKQNRAAIVTTLRNAATTMRSFLAYHRAIGFQHFYWFFDDPADPMLDWARAQPDVTVIPRDADLERAWRTLTLWNGTGPHVEREVMARQILNAEHAINLARAAGFDWLLHIDSDELFYVPEGDATGHFAALAETQIDTLAYLNFEAVPETEDAGDFFRTVTLFKTPVAELPSPLPTAEQALITRAGQDAEAYFHFYGNGKAAARLATSDMLPDSVHRFQRRGPFTEGWARGPFILHYACCDFEAFRQKYVTLGRFADKWWGQVDIAVAVGPFHLAARDAVMDAVEASDIEIARRFYRERLMITDTALIAEMMRLNLLRRVEGPRDILAKLSEQPAV